mmetsp:Transcript_7434/g.24521  ORF Transcript_7434/g.24521 Transcript_7434/m.24521 type:complete len:259 (-) Transcript_7434:103-879(-)|eukprot:CAMPEP_0118897438 /NCGR_PEP_ID=MMETSP1166-20130328/4839_1 /TAXON_ID=1104430 /ORGANISM="Chrysoreinhardia sp, Strain CCMP3193" /LENGTH=258 /DNA_ID=CAMNT_0006836509 /DNA_START=26 /DNA_END=802 /DNA_ORIENTATION=+
MAAQRSSSAEAWVKGRVLEVLDPGLGLDVDVLVSTLVAQPDAASVKAEAVALFRLGPLRTPATLKLERAIEDVARHLYPPPGAVGNKRKKKAVVAAKKPVARRPVNCLRCGFVNAVAAPDDGGASYDDHMAAIRKIRDQWPKCAVCGDALQEQLRFGDYEDDDDGLRKAVDLAARLFRYDRETARRTKVVDDQADWYAPPEPTSRTKNFTLDFAGRKVVIQEDQEEEPTGAAFRRIIGDHDDDDDDVQVVPRSPVPVV